MGRSKCNLLKIQEIRAWPETCSRGRRGQKDATRHDRNFTRFVSTTRSLLDAMMFQLPRALRVVSRHPPHAFEWWKGSIRHEDPVEQIRRIRRQLGFAIADAGKRPPFLHALGRETDVQLQQLAGRATFEVGELASELRERCQLLGKTVDHFSDVVAASVRTRDSIELSDCAREAVAELSGEMRLRLVIQGERRVTASRWLVTSLFEVAIRSASARTEDEVEVILPPCSGTWAEFRIAWPKSSTTAGGRTQADHDKARFFALAVAYALKLDGTLSRCHTQDQEILSVRIPIADRSADFASPARFLDLDVLGQAAAF